MTEQELWALVNKATLGAWKWMNSGGMNADERQRRAEVYMALTVVRAGLDR